MATLIWVRHGVTRENLEKRYIGHFDAALAPEGHSQAKQLAELLKKIQIHAIYSSDLRRAKDTAAHIAVHHSDVPITYSTYVREVSFGLWEGKTYEDIEAIDLEAVYDFYNDPWKNPPSKGETLTQLKDRVDTFLQTLLDQYKENETVLIVCHGGIIKLFEACYLEDDPSCFFQMKISHGEKLVCSFNHSLGRWQRC